ncbi:integrase core domain-containing protein [Ktedonobacter sp. SOSP1-52]|uniref:integrase core domain-containing protein n=1 Tax=Ktedonobacter sp. SOSP1-52 TaxID=2778366 RepID=UPI001916835A
MEGGARKKAATYFAGCLPYFVGLFKLAVAERRSYATLGAFLRAAQDWVLFYNTLRPHESLKYRSPDQFAQEHGLPVVPPITLLSCLAF